MQCKEWGDANSELFKEPHDEAVHENSYKSKLYELISASLDFGAPLPTLEMTGQHDAAVFYEKWIFSSFSASFCPFRAAR